MGTAPPGCDTLRSRLGSSSGGAAPKQPGRLHYSRARASVSIACETLSRPAEVTGPAGLSSPALTLKQITTARLSERLRRTYGFPQLTRPARSTMTRRYGGFSFVGSLNFLVYLT
jgi:hypothetical protein